MRLCGVGRVVLGCLFPPSTQIPKPNADPSPLPSTSWPVRSQLSSTLSVDTAASELQFHHPEQAQETHLSLCVRACVWVSSHSACVSRNLQTDGLVALSTERRISCSRARAELARVHGTVKLGKEWPIGD